MSGFLPFKCPEQLILMYGSEHRHTGSIGCFGGIHRGNEHGFENRHPARQALMESAPQTGRSSPVRESSPKKRALSGGASISPAAARMESRIGRSYAVPAFWCRQVRG